MPRGELSFRGRIFLLTIALSVFPTVGVALLAMRHLDRSVDLWSNRGVAHTLAVSRTLADSLVAWEGPRIEADPRLTQSMADLEAGMGFYRRLELLAPVEKRALALEMGIIVVAMIGVALVFAARAGARLTQPLGLLMEGTARLRAGDLEHRIPVAGGGEIARLIASWNEMTASLRASRERIRRIERTAAWGEAARRVAHEIKNPLTPIEVSLHRVRRRLDEMPDVTRASVEEATRAMLEEVEKLRRLAEEFSAFSRLPSPRPAPCDVAALLQEEAVLHARDGLAIRASAARIPPLLVDGALLRIALGNLVRNASEAVGECGTIDLTAEYDGHALTIVVADSGPGIPAADRERIFDPYFTTKPRGTGIGLPLVERIVVDQGGTLSLEGGAGLGGARFRIELPAKPADAGAAPAGLAGAEPVASGAAALPPQPTRRTRGTESHADL